MPGQPGSYVEPERKKILDREKALKIPTPADFATKASRDALYKLNMESATKNMTPSDMAKDELKKRQAKPFSYKKGGMVKKSGTAKVHKGEMVVRKTARKKA